jgi:adenylate kinase
MHIYTYVYISIGVGKSQLCRRLIEVLGGQVGAPTMRHIKVGALACTYALQRDCSRDAERDCFILDSDAEDALLDELEEEQAKGGCLLDYHANGLFPKRWAHLVVVLSCDIRELRRRLEGRNYTASKVDENVQAEIMEVVADEAYESYDNSIIWRLRNDSTEDQDANCLRLAAWLSHRSNPQRHSAVSAPHEGAQHRQAEGSDRGAGRGSVKVDREQDTKLNYPNLH